jgi:hypothetical protein
MVELVKMRPIKRAKGRRKSVEEKRLKRTNTIEKTKNKLGKACKGFRASGCRSEILILAIPKL